jgi:hypothetical protein
VVHPRPRTLLRLGTLFTIARIRYAAGVVRRRSVVAFAALIAAAALAGLPVPVGSKTASASRDLQSAAFTSVIVTANAPAPRAWGEPDAAQRSESFLADPVVLTEPGRAPTAPKSRPVAVQPGVSAGSDWKTPLSQISGQATFYNAGTTAMRLPLGTVVRICGAGGCIERTVTDYGPLRSTRIIDMYRPDFFAICGCASSSGITWVTVSVY